MQMKKNFHLTKKILLGTARIIKDEIKQVTSTRNQYPSSVSMESCQENPEYLPYSLRFLLSILLQANNLETHIASIGQALVRNTFPSLILALIVSILILASAT